MRVSGVVCTVGAFKRTVTVQRAVLPFLLLAVMVVVPTFLPVTLPEADTVATEGLLDFQETD